MFARSIQKMTGAFELSQLPSHQYNHDQGDSVGFSAKLDDARLIACLLKCVAFQSVVQFQVRQGGMKFLCQKNRAVQAHVSLNRTHFRDLSLLSNNETVNPNDETARNDETMVFSVDIQVLLECLDLFGHAGGPLVANGSGGNESAAKSHSSQKMTAVMLEYKDNQLELILEEDGMISSCSLATFDDLDCDAFEFGDADCCAKVILNSSWLCDALNNASAEDAKISFEASSNHTNCLVVEIASGISTVQVSFPKDSEVVQYSSCSHPVRFSYKLPVQSLIATLQISTKTSIRINENGLISIQAIVPLNSREQVAFVEYLAIPLLED